MRRTSQIWLSIALLLAIGGICFAWTCQDYLAEGRRRLARGEVQLARRYLLEAVRLDLTSAEARMALADAMAALEEWELAATELQHAVRLKPGLLRKPQYRPGVYGSRAHLDKVIQRIKRRVKKAPDDTAAQLILGYNHLFLDQSADAKKAFARALNSPSRSKFVIAATTEIESGRSHQSRQAVKPAPQPQKAHSAPPSNSASTSASSTGYSGSSSYTSSGSSGSGYSSFETPSASYGNSIPDNSSYYGQISSITGAPKTTYVRGYTRSDGTQVRGHYRSRR